jgi:hypothetical protein
MRDKKLTQSAVEHWVFCEGHPPALAVFTQRARAKTANDCTRRD